jgi:uncharacterized protein
MKLARLKKEENIRFTQFIKQVPSAPLDEKVHRISTYITSKIDCTKCANCCKAVEPGITEEEITKLANLKNLSGEIFEREFTKKEPPTGITFLHRQPCTFLKDHLCTIYENRPASCSDYPHLQQPRFKFRIKAMMENYKICPIVFNTVEQLKSELEFQHEGFAMSDPI